MATRGEYFTLGDELSRKRSTEAAMNTPIDTGSSEGAKI
jgi:hypothetical protein